MGREGRLSGEFHFFSFGFFFFYPFPYLYHRRKPASCTTTGPLPFRSACPFRALSYNNSTPHPHSLQQHQQQNEDFCFFRFVKQLYFQTFFYFFFWKDSLPPCLLPCMSEIWIRARCVAKRAARSHAYSFFLSSTLPVEREVKTKKTRTKTFFVTASPFGSFPHFLCFPRGNASRNLHRDAKGGAAQKNASSGSEVSGLPSGCSGAGSGATIIGNGSAPVVDDDADDRPPSPSLSRLGSRHLVAVLRRRFAAAA